MQALEGRIADLEARQQLLLDVVSALFDDLQPEGHAFSMMAMQAGFTAVELHAMETLFDWARERGPEHLPREELARAFAVRLPGHRMEWVMAAHRRDHRYPELCRLVLDEES